MDGRSGGRNAWATVHRSLELQVAAEFMCEHIYEGEKISRVICVPHW
jgi:hypothetical protein